MVSKPACFKGDSLGCRQRRHSRHHDNSLVSLYQWPPIQYHGLHWPFMLGIRRWPGFHHIKGPHNPENVSTITSSLPTFTRLVTRIPILIITLISPYTVDEARDFIRDNIVGIPEAEVIIVRLDVGKLFHVAQTLKVKHLQNDMRK